MTNEHTSLEKIYLSHFIRKGCESAVCERWVGDGTDCNILTPSSSDYSSTSFSFCWAAQPGILRAQALSGSWFSLPRTATRTPTNWFQLTWTVCGTGLYNCLTSTCFLWASHLHRIQHIHMSRWYLQPDAPVSRLMAGSKVNVLQSDLVMIWKKEKKLPSYIFCYSCG